MITLTYRRAVIYSIVSLVGILLLISLVVIYENNRIIDKHRHEMQEAEQVRMHSLELIRSLHLLDLGIRGYAITPNTQFFVPFDSAVLRRQRMMPQLEELLRHQQYAMHNFYAFREEVNTYFNVALTLRKYLEWNEREKFKQLFDADHGFTLQKAYRAFLADVTAFEEKITQQAQIQYDRAVTVNYWTHALLFVISLPLLLYLAFYANRTFLVMSQLAAAEQEKAQILADQNTTLQIQVQERTNDLTLMNEEITAQNEEIISQNEEIVSTNDMLSAHKLELERQHEELTTQHSRLLSAHAVIEQQNEVILRYNDDLVNEVNHQTDYLMRANSELKDRNSQLEQFTYVISHNLRGPMSRIQGLATIIDLAQNEAERKDIAHKMSISSYELDRVIKDLTMITDIRNVQNKPVEKLDIQKVLDNVLLMLKPETEAAQARIEISLQVESIRSILSYLENVLFNLIGNAVKFRDVKRPLFIRIASYRRHDVTVIEVKDNGLGIDLQRYRNQLFIPYKRFHYHVEGKGLGLYLAKTQTEALDGTLEVDSQDGIGSTFRMLFRERV